MGRGQIEKDIVIYSLIINSNNYVKFYDCLDDIKVYYTMFFTCVYSTCYSDYIYHTWHSDLMVNNLPSREYIQMLLLFLFFSFFNRFLVYFLLFKKQDLKLTLKSMFLHHNTFNSRPLVQLVNSPLHFPPLSMRWKTRCLACWLRCCRVLIVPVLFFFNTSIRVS